MSTEQKINNETGVIRRASRFGVSIWQTGPGTYAVIGNGTASGFSRWAHAWAHFKAEYESAKEVRIAEHRKTLEELTRNVGPVPVTMKKISNTDRRRARRTHKAAMHLATQALAEYAAIVQRRTGTELPVSGWHTRRDFFERAAARALSGVL